MNGELFDLVALDHQPCGSVLGDSTMNPICHIKGCGTSGYYMHKESVKLASTRLASQPFSTKLFCKKPKSSEETMISNRAKQTLSYPLSFSLKLFCKRVSFSSGNNDKRMSGQIKSHPHFQTLYSTAVTSIFQKP